jgi:hypothetical protein
MTKTASQLSIMPHGAGWKVASASQPVSDEQKRAYRVVTYHTADTVIATEIIHAWTHEEALRQCAERHGLDAEGTSVTGNPGAASNCLYDPRHPMGGVVAFRTRQVEE